eukprot:11050400-Alexandrium_andersonii.AAC.1
MVRRLQKALSRGGLEVQAGKCQVVYNRHCDQRGALQVSKGAVPVAGQGWLLVLGTRLCPD